ncbi:MAG: radical SAM protein [Candidatus Electrothrix sp. AW3_4]|nr:radical SAM protein [Candidatus Electrothrix gigas]
MYFFKSQIQNIKVMKNLILNKPISVVFDVTKKCNHRCNTCNIWRSIGSENDMSVANIKDKINILSKFGVGYIFVQGGEPLIRGDIQEIIISCIEKSIKPTIVTNGTLLTSEMMTFLQKYSCNLAISLDSLDKNVYLKTRGVDTLDNVLNNIQMASKYKIKGNKAITTTVNQLNFKEVWKLKDFSERYGFMYAIRPYIYTERAGRKEDELIYKNKESIIEVFKKMALISKKENFLASLIYEKHIQYLKSEELGRCDALTRSFLMKEDGSCSYCIEFPDKIFSKFSGYKEFINDYNKAIYKYDDEIVRCSKNTPCFFNCAWSVGILWNSKKRIIYNAPRIIKSMLTYGYFF